MAPNDINPNNRPSCPVNFDQSVEGIVKILCLIPLKSSQPHL